jgi:hypothetical protein
MDAEQRGRRTRTAKEEGKMVKRALLCVVLAVALTGMSYGAAMDQGSKELALAGSLDFDTAFDTQVVLDTGLGYFIQDNLQLGPLAGVFYNDLITLVRLGAFLEYNIDIDSPLTPFVGAAALWVNGDLEDGDDEQAVVGSLRAGLKYFVEENWAIALTGVFEAASEDVYAEDDEDELTDTDWRMELGIRVYFD